MHDHEEGLEYDLFACRTPLVSGNCTSWEILAADQSVNTSGEGKEACSDTHLESAHPPGDQGCSDPLPDPKTCHQAADRSSWPCAISFDEHIWAASSCTSQAITAFRVFFKGDNVHAHVADAIWILNGPSCTIQGINPQATTTLKDAQGAVLQTVTDSPYEFGNLPAGRTYTVESDGASVNGTTLCINATDCHTPVNSTNTAFQSGKTRQVVNCPADGFADLYFHSEAPTEPPTEPPTVPPTVPPTDTPTEPPTPTSIPPYCAQGASITLSEPPATDAGTIRLRLKFQGVDEANIATQENRTQHVRVSVIKQLAETGTGLGLQTISSKTFSDVEVKTTGEKDANGISIWEGTFAPTAIAPGGNYSILIKGPKHLQRKFCENNPTEQAEEGFPYTCKVVGQITLSEQENVLDFSNVLLQAGDLPDTGRGQDGVVNAIDVSLVLNMIRNGFSEAPNDLLISDMDLNGVVNAKDRSYLVETLEEKYGDEEPLQ